MRVVLFGCGSKASAILNKLIELKEDVVGLVYANIDQHENVWYKLPFMVAIDNEIPIIHCKSIEILKVLKDWNPDVIIVAGWRYKIPKEQYSIPPKGTIVFHDSLLPEYRGFAPLNWAIINGETKMGATMFYIAEEIDSGDIIGQAEIPINENNDAKMVEEKMVQAYCGLLTTYLPLIKLDRVKRTPQVGIPTYCCKRIPEDGLIDWNKPSYDIYNLIRGLTYPYPGAFTYLHDNKTPRKLIIWKSKLEVDQKRYSGSVAGRVAEIVKRKGVRILTGDGTLLIEEVSFENGIKVRADDVIKSIRTTLSAIDK